MQYASVAIAEELPVEKMKMMARGHNDRTMPRSFKDFVFEVRIEGNLTQAQLEGLARDASEQCFVENTLAKAIPVVTDVYLNGKKSLTLTKGPSTLG